MFVLGEDFQRFRDRETAIENLARWIDAGCPCRDTYQLWGFVPKLSCSPCGDADGVPVHAIELKFTAGELHQYYQEVRSADISGMSNAQVFQYFVGIMDARGWAMGFFGINGEAI